VGRQVCAECHAAAAAAWAGSDHDRAMEIPTPETVRGDFEDRSFEHHGVTTHFRRVASEYRIQTEGPGGATADYAVQYTFGVRPLQQYLLEIEPGRLQVFGVAWDTQARRWFSLYPDERIPHDDPLHWTQPAQNWNRNCADCHSTGVSTHYDPVARRYQTRWRELDVSCEACHGAGSAHLTWVEAGGESSEPADFQSGRRAERGASGFPVHLRPAAPQDRDRKAQAIELEVCAPCHSRRSRVYPGGGPGSRFLDHYRLALLTPELYRADGQISAEVFTYGSFLQSRMYAEGVRCSHCHDPHTAELIVRGNALCGQCHEPQRYDAPAHHHHTPATAGAECVNCHMVARTYMGVDARRDHGFHLPRPDLSEEIGVPNACSGCHADRREPAARSASSAGASGGSSAQWASARINEWFGAQRPDDRHAARALAAGRARTPGAEASLVSLAANAERPGIVRATAFELLSQFAVTPAARGAATAGLVDGDAIVRTAAINSLVGLPAEEFAKRIAPLLTDPIRSVRMEAARALAPVVAGLRESDPALARRHEAALDEYRAGQRALSDWPEAHLNLAVIHEQLGQPGRAREAYETAITLDSDFVPAHYNLALLHDAANRAGAAEGELRKVIELAPTFSDGHYSLGLLLAADASRMDEAAVALETAASLAPERGRVLYNAGVAQQTLGRVDRAEVLLRAALVQEPEEVDFVAGLMILYLQQDRRLEALPMARKLLELAPNDASARALVRDLEGAAPPPATH